MDKLNEISLNDRNKDDFSAYSKVINGKLHINVLYSFDSIDTNLDLIELLKELKSKTGNNNLQYNKLTDGKISLIGDI